MTYCVQLKSGIFVKHSNICPNCNVPLKVQNQILNANHLIVLKFDVWDGIDKSALNYVPGSSVKIENHLRLVCTMKGEVQNNA